MSSPNHLKFTAEHEWVRLENGVAVVGITDHAQKALGDITYLDFPPAGKRVNAHDELAVIESVKAASDIFAPVGGTVDAVNDILSTEPERVNRDPYGEGWICRLKEVREADLAALMSATEYDAYVAGLK